MVTGIGRGKSIVASGGKIQSVAMTADMQTTTADWNGVTETEIDHGRHVGTEMGIGTETGIGTVPVTGGVTTGKDVPSMIARGTETRTASRSRRRRSRQRHSRQSL